MSFAATTEQMIAQRIDQLKEWLIVNAPGVDIEQNHLVVGSIERAYWHYGYLQALRDVINAQAMASRFDERRAPPVVTPIISSTK